MLFQIRSPRKRLITNGAGMRLLSRVDPLVAPQIGEVVHFHSAITTLVHGLCVRLLVQPHVMQQAVRMHKLFVTFLALEQRLSGVDVLVFLQVVPKHETFVTEGAGKLFQLGRHVLVLGLVGGAVDEEAVLVEEIFSANLTNVELPGLAVRLEVGVVVRDLEESFSALSAREFPLAVSGLLLSRAGRGRRCQGRGRCRLRRTERHSGCCWSWCVSGICNHSHWNIV